MPRYVIRIYRRRQALVALSAVLLLQACGPAASQDQKEQSRFSVVSDDGGNAWRIDTRTGEVWRCWQGTAGYVPPQCYKAIVH